MDKIASTTSILELAPEELIIATQLEPSTYVVTVKVYEREHFLANPNLSVNQKQIDLYSIYPGRLIQTFAEIKDKYEGWSKIDKTLPTELIGIHNQDPYILYIQFSINQRYFQYKRCLASSSETVQEELFGRKDHSRLRALCHEDEQYLISKLRFMPKAKKAISFYSLKTSYGFTHAKRHLTFR
ncbi:hypothetical protein E4K67_11785 [Desulfosporosinus fructosivorans]|uniref:Uncharacterized protein n=1 Tax=Desulfosporosinus fructosivorans TaxID=2018669 RepID=A0A4Z0RAC7_9FIRM|nr:hypothetical protein [Desulfosporosinus fructosivorans]TGE38596.1 hypothetical protein E4K67_11785 [Desulfosporosinus fructosivorans]